MKLLCFSAVLCCSLAIVTALQCRVGYELVSDIDSSSEFQNVVCPTSADHCLYSSGVATIFGSLSLRLKAGLCSNESTCRPQSCQAQRNLFAADPTATSVLTLPLVFISCTFACCQDNLCNYNLTSVRESETGFVHIPSDSVTPETTSIAETTPTQTTTTTPTTTTTLPPPATLVPLNGLQCVEGYDVQSDIIDALQWNVTNCRGDDLFCVTAKGQVLIDGYINANVTAGKCVSADYCEASRCSDVGGLLVNSSVDILKWVNTEFPYEIQSCSSTCCQENLCNEPVEPTTSTSVVLTTTPPPVASTLATANGLTCDRGYEVDISLLADSELSSQWNERKCFGENLYCLRAKAYVVVASVFPSNVDAGLCVSKTLCETEDCATIAALMISTDPAIEEVVTSLGYDIANCSTICCQDNLCNRQTIEQIAASTLPNTQAPTETTTTTSAPTETTTTTPAETETTTTTTISSTSMASSSTTDKPASAAPTAFAESNTTTCGSDSLKGKNHPLLIITTVSFLLAILKLF